MIKLSIIIPVYNVQDYIRECIESVLNQTIKEIEIIVVDDGSLDNSMKIVNQFSDNRIKIIRQENKGLSSARNAGISIAKGEYIAFIDSDDFIIHNKSYEEMYNIAIKEKSDIVAGNCIWYYSKEKYFDLYRDMSSFNHSPMNSEEYFISCLKTDRIYMPVWLNIYNLDFIRQNNLYFKEGIFHEDEEFMPRVLIKAKKVSIYDISFYAYRQREGSIMNSEKNIKKCNDIMDICIEIYKLSEKIENEELKRLLIRKSILTIQDTVYKYRYKNISNEIRKILLNKSIDKSLKVRSFFMIYNIELYFKIEKMIRLLKNK